MTRPNPILNRILGLAVPLWMFATMALYLLRFGRAFWVDNDESIRQAIAQCAAFIRTFF